MIVGIASDHRGIELKTKIINYLHEKGFSCIDFGTNSHESVDYVDYAVKLCKGINDKQVNIGILICGTGIGMSIAANKIKGIRCAKVSTIEEAKLCKEHNMANVMALSENTNNVFEIVDNFLNTEYSTDERHLRRVEKINTLEKARI